MASRSASRWMDCARSLAGFQRAAFALIDRVHGDFRSQRAALLKNRRKRLLAAVIYQQHVELFFL